LGTKFLGVREGSIMIHRDTIFKRRYISIWLIEARLDISGLVL
jgi:hypothetical protein